MNHKSDFGFVTEAAYRQRIKEFLLNEKQLDENSIMLYNEGKKRERILSCHFRKQGRNRKTVLTCWHTAPMIPLCGYMTAIYWYEAETRTRTIEFSV